MEVLKKLKTELPYNPAIPLLGIHLKESKSVYDRHACTPMFIMAIFTIGHIMESAIVYIYTMEFSSAIEKDEIMSFVVKWMEIIHGDVKQKNPVPQR
jgi:hypothetical protein